jgi:hypothetical protein
VTRIADGRYVFELDADTRPEPLVGDLASAGAALVSVTPIRTTLEDVFLRALGRLPGQLAGDRTLPPALAGTVERADR